jgi:hypothetical protein
LIDLLEYFPGGIKVDFLEQLLVLFEIFLWIFEIVFLNFFDLMIFCIFKVLNNLVVSQFELLPRNLLFNNMAIWGVNLLICRFDLSIILNNLWCPKSLEVLLFLWHNNSYGEISFFLFILGLTTATECKKT